MGNNSDEGWENPYRVRALVHIVRDEEIPAELEKKMQEFDEKHLQEQLLNFENEIYSEYILSNKEVPQQIIIDLHVLIEQVHGKGIRKLGYTSVHKYYSLFQLQHILQILLLPLMEM